MKKIPLIDLLCLRDERISRKEHYARILCGEVYVGGQCERDPRQPVRLTACIDHKSRKRYVSRGGDKLAGVLKQWKIEVTGMSFIDAGASTGGFTDCLLQHGASRVMAIEAGGYRLDYRLRRDERVIVLENTNIMSVHTLPFVPEAAVADLSLRSLRKAAIHILNLVSRKWLIALVKPQYEWSAPPVDFNGVVSQASVLSSILQNCLEDLRAEGAYVCRIAASPLPGRRGNREFFCFLTADKDQAQGDLGKMIEQALERED